MRLIFDINKIVLSIISFIAVIYCLYAVHTMLAAAYIIFVSSRIIQAGIDTYVQYIAQKALAEQIDAIAAAYKNENKK